VPARFVTEREREGEGEGERYGEVWADRSLRLGVLWFHHKEQM
jgi:hypothetical protein